MFADNPRPNSDLDSDTFDLQTSRYSRYPISNAHEEPASMGSASSPAVATQLDITQIKRNTQAPSTHLASIPPAREIYPGIWSDKTISVSHPSVQDCLKQASSSSLHGAYHPVVYALAALHFYYKPYEKGHWAFWSKEKRSKTADIVNKIYFHKPRVIRSPTAWIGIKESLFVLTNLQASWRPQLTDLPWYAVYAPRSEVPTKRVLRKRKAASSSTGATTQLLDEDEGLEQPPKKRPRNKRTVSSRKSVRPATIDGASDGTPAEQQLDFIIVDPSVRPSHNVQQASATACDVLPTSVTTPHDLEQSRPPQQELDMERRSRSRTRSSSQSSGDTAVSFTAGHRPRSLSVMSALTAVASLVDEKEEKAAKLDIVLSLVEEEPIANVMKTRSGRMPRPTARALQLKQNAGASTRVVSSEPIKRGRGRPRKHLPA